MGRASIASLQLERRAACSAALGTVLVAGSLWPKAPLEAPAQLAAGAGPDHAHADELDRNLERVRGIAGERPSTPVDIWDSPAERDEPPVPTAAAVGRPMARRELATAGEVTAQGPGTLAPIPASLSASGSPGFSARGAWPGGSWSEVFVRQLPPRFEGALALAHATRPS
jgi:hypothetical protein